MTSPARVFVAGVASFALIAAAGCGGSKAPSVASVGTPRVTTGSTSAASAQIAWAACIRSHGVPDFPDPDSNGQVSLKGIDINSPQFLAAHEACLSLVPPNHGRTPAQERQLVAHQLAVAECMRKQGVPNFPDPNSQGTFPRQTWTAQTSPQAQAAEKICNPGTG